MINGKKIQLKILKKTADLARNDLQEFIQKSKESHEQSFQKISEDINQSKELKNYSEINVNQWTKELNNLQSQIENYFFIQISNQSFPNLIQVKQNNKRQLEQNEQSVKRSKNEFFFQL